MGKYTKLIRADVMTSEEALKEMAETYNRKVPVFAKNWATVTPTKKGDWKEGVETLIGAEVKEEYANEYERGVKRIGENFRKFVEGKGKKLVENYKKKLAKSVAG